MANLMLKDSNGVLWTPPCLIRWPNVFEPSLPKGSDPGKTPLFSAVAIMSGHEPQFAEFRQLLTEELDRACLDKHGASIPEMQQRGRLKLAVKRNNDPEAGKLGTAGFKERPDGIHFNAATQFMVGVVDKSPTGGGMRLGKEQSALVYDGIFGRIGVTAWGWSHPTGGKGVSLNLQGVVKLYDGEKLGGVQADVDAVDGGDYVPEGAITGAPDVGAGGGDNGAGQQQQQQNGAGQQQAGGDFGF